METTVLSGIWLYGGIVPRRIEITAVAVEFAHSRYHDAEVDDGIDPTTPIPVTEDGFVYYVGHTTGGEFLSLAAAKAWAETQPWAPITWQDAPENLAQ
jgi:hypothetical protein